STSPPFARELRSPRGGKPKPSRLLLAFSDHRAGLLRSPAGETTGRAKLGPSLLLAVAPGEYPTHSFERNGHGDQHQTDPLLPSPPRRHRGSDPHEALRHRHVPPRFRWACHGQLGRHGPAPSLPPLPP